MRRVLLALAAVVAAAMPLPRAAADTTPSDAHDTNTFLSCFGLRNKVTVRKIDGGAPRDPEGTIEPEIDIQQAATQAPDAAIVSYEAPHSDFGELDAYSRIVADDTTDRVLADRALLRRVNLVHEHAHAHGDTVHVHEHAVHHHD